MLVGSGRSRSCSTTRCRARPEHALAPRADHGRAGRGRRIASVPGSRRCSRPTRRAGRAGPPLPADGGGERLRPLLARLAARTAPRHAGGATAPACTSGPVRAAPPTVADLAHRGSAQRLPALPDSGRQRPRYVPGGRRPLGVPAAVIHLAATCSTSRPLHLRADLLLLPAATYRRRLPGTARGADQPRVLVLLPAELLPARAHPAPGAAAIRSARRSGTPTTTRATWSTSPCCSTPRRMPRYLWMARHADEGEAYRWGIRRVQWTATTRRSTRRWAAMPATRHCGIQRRSRTYFINDYVVCIRAPDLRLHARGDAAGRPPHTCGRAGAATSARPGPGCAGAWSASPRTRRPVRTRPCCSRRTSPPPATCPGHAEARGAAVSRPVRRG